MTIYSVPVFASPPCSSCYLYRVTRWTELGCVRPSFLSTLWLSIYLSHRLCGSPACCLVTGWSELDTIMTAALIRPDPIFNLCFRPAQPEWLFEVRPGWQMKSTSSGQTNQTKRAFVLCYSLYESQGHKCAIGTSWSVWNWETVVILNCNLRI